MKRHYDLFLFFLIPFLLGGCTTPLSMSDASATANAGGCWPYDSSQPRVTETPLPTQEGGSGAGTEPEGTTISNPTPTLWPECTPVADVPTRTPTVTPVQTLIPVHTPQPIGAAASASQHIQEVADQPGVSTALTSAVHSRTGQLAVAWITWRWSDDETQDGQVWIRVQDTSRQWQYAQTLNALPVQKDFGGVGIVWLDTGELLAFWSEGANTPVQMMKSSNSGQTWTAPESIGIHGSVQRSLRDSNDGVHLLIRAVDGETPQTTYAYLANGQWIVASIAGARFHSDLAVLDTENGPVRFIALADSGQSVIVLRSETGYEWASTNIDTHRYMYEEFRQDISIGAWQRADGDVVAVAWSQYAQEGVFAAVSIDGGKRWSSEERIAQKVAPMDDTGERHGCCGAGWKPSLAYDPSTESIVAAWLQKEFIPSDQPDSRGQSGWQVMLSYRPLDSSLRASVETWNLGVDPTTDRAETVPVALTERGWTGKLQQHGTYTLFLSTDARNFQWRIYVRIEELSGYTSQGES